MFFSKLYAFDIDSCWKWASQMAQWYRIHLQMQETHKIWVQSPRWKDPGVGNSNLLQYSRLEKSMDRGA